MWYLGGSMSWYHIGTNLLYSKKYPVKGQKQLQIQNGNKDEQSYFLFFCYRNIMFQKKKKKENFSYEHPFRSLYSVTRKQCITTGIWTSKAVCVWLMVEWMMRKCHHIQCEKPEESSSISNTLLIPDNLNK